MGSDLKTVVVVVVVVVVDGSMFVDELLAKLSEFATEFLCADSLELSFFNGFLSCLNGTAPLIFMDSMPMLMNLSFGFLVVVVVVVVVVEAGSVADIIVGLDEPIGFIIMEIEGLMAEKSVLKLPELRTVCAPTWLSITVAVGEVVVFEVVVIEVGL